MAADPLTQEFENSSRREFLKWGSRAAVFALFCGGNSVWGYGSEHGTGSSNAERLKALHVPELKVPSYTRNGTHVPLIVWLAHPMEARHHIKRVHIFNESDPLPSKGVFYPTPANGEAYLAFQARMHSGTSWVKAVAECNLHGQSSTGQRITIPEGKGGCATADNNDDAEEYQIRPPMIRIPDLVRRGKLRKGAITEVQIKFKHPNRTGLDFQDGKFIRKKDPFYIESMELFYGDQRVSRYEMTPGLSDNPFLALKLRLEEEKPIRVLFRNSRGQKFEAMQEILLSHQS